MSILKKSVYVCILRVYVTCITVSEYVDLIKKDRCGYESCTPTHPDKLNVHLVPHTHNDLGWTSTLDQYYYGDEKFKGPSVKKILNSVVKELWDRPERRFTYVESAYFFRWWHEQPDIVKRKVQILVRQGRLQFAGGAWSMNDEATTNYQAIIDSFTLGLRKLNDTFGACGRPLVAWQIDTFGNSKEFASLLSAMGFDGVFLGRIDHNDMKARLANNTMEFLWKGDENSEIFTSILYHLYTAPNGFCFDARCMELPINDVPKSPWFNAVEKAQEFIQYAIYQSYSYKTNHILIPMGGDFMYESASRWYKNMDKLIKVSNGISVKRNYNVTLFYSTPACYMKAVRAANPVLETTMADFFPISSDPHSYWTGYYSSRPSIKLLERQANAFLQMVKQLQVLAGVIDHEYNVLVEQLRIVIGILQHHTAITGTCSQAVADDYVDMVTGAVDDASFIPSMIFNAIMQENGSRVQDLYFKRCRLNESSCSVSESENEFVVLVYNPLAWKLKEPIRIPVPEGKYEVFKPNGHKMIAEMVNIPEVIKNIPTRKSSATHELVFIAYLKPLSFKTYFVQKEITKDEIRSKTQDYRNRIMNVMVSIEKYTKSENNLANISNKNDIKTEFPDIEIFKNTIQMSNKKSNMSCKFCEENDDNSTVIRLKEKISKRIKREIENEDDVLIDNQAVDLVAEDQTAVNINVRYYYYAANQGEQNISRRGSSGHYIFTPNGSPIEINMENAERIINSVMSEVRSTSPMVFNYLRVYNGVNFFENEWIVGPIDVSDNVGKEVIVRYETDISNGHFVTDSNGRQKLIRIIEPSELVSKNYYPVSNVIGISDGNKKATVLVDRAEGGTSLKSGDIELMLHRRLIRDHNKGINEALNETVDGKGVIVRGRHRILISNSNNKTNYIQERKLGIQLSLQPQVMLAKAQMHLEGWLKMVREFVFCYALPKGIHLLTLEYLGNDLLLIRLENIFEDVNGRHVIVDLNRIFINIKLYYINEAFLGANMWKHNDKVSFSQEGEEKSKTSEDVNKKKHRMKSFKVAVKPREIRTFIAKFSYKI